MSAASANALAAAASAAAATSTCPHPPTIQISELFGVKGLAPAYIDHKWFAFPYAWAQKFLASEIAPGGKMDIEFRGADANGMAKSWTIPCRRCLYKDYYFHLYGARTMLDDLCLTVTSSALIYRDAFGHAPCIAGVTSVPPAVTALLPAPAARPADDDTPELAAERARLLDVMPPPAGGACKKLGPSETGDRFTIRFNAQIITPRDNSGFLGNVLNTVAQGEIVDVEVMDGLDQQWVLKFRIQPNGQVSCKSEGVISALRAQPGEYIVLYHDGSGDKRIGLTTDVEFLRHMRFEIPRSRG